MARHGKSYRRPVSSPRELRRFGLVMAVALGALGAFLLWRHKPAAPVLLALSAAFLLAGLMAPRLLTPLERAWMTLARWLSVVMTYVILTATFYLVITPMGLLLRLLGKDLLGLRLERQRRSYWAPVDPDGPAGRADRPY